MGKDPVTEWGPPSPIIEEVWPRLLALGGIEKEGFTKRRVELIRIQPKADPGLTPGRALGGTFSLSRANTNYLIQLGDQDTRAALKSDIHLEEGKGRPLPKIFGEQ